MGIFKMSANNNVTVTAAGKQGKKGRRTKYRVLDLSENSDAIDRVREHGGASEDTLPDCHEREGGEKEEEVKEIDDIDDHMYDDLEDEEEDTERQREVKDKSQEYNLFVKSNRRRGHCTTKKSKRQRSGSR